MAKFAGFDIETPQEVLQRTRMMRQQQIASNNPLLLQDAMFGRALDSLFGNPDVRAAELKMKRLQESQAKIVPEEGESELDGEIRRLAAARDAVSDLDPNLGDQIRARLVELEGVRVERQKLLAEEAREAQKFGTDQLAAGINIAQDMNESQTWRKGAQLQEVLKTDTETQARLRSEGWTTEAPSTEAEATARLGLSKNTEAKLEDSIIAFDRQLATMGAAGAAYNPEFLTWSGQGKQWLRTQQGKLAPGTLTQAQIEMSAQYNEWRAGTLDSLNRLIKEITGAAMSITEAERITATAPNLDDDDVAYLSKSRRIVRDILSARARAKWASDNGVIVSSREDWDKYDLNTFGNVSEAEVDTVMQRMFGVTGKMGSREKVGERKTKSGVTFTVE